MSAGTASTIVSYTGKKLGSLRSERRWALWTAYASLIVATIIFLAPPFYMLVTSLKSSAEISNLSGNPWIVKAPIFRMLAPDTFKAGSWGAAVVVVGAWTNMAVEHTVREAADHGYEVTVVSDATSSLSDEWQHAAINYALTNIATIATDAKRNWTGIPNLSHADNGTCPSDQPRQQCSSTDRKLSWILPNSPIERHAPMKDQVFLQYYCNPRANPVCHDWQEVLEDVIQVVPSGDSADEFDNRHKDAPDPAWHGFTVPTECLYA